MVVGDPLEISLKGIVLDQDSIEIHNLEMLETDPTADGFGIPKNYRRWQCDQDNAGPYLMKPAVHAPRPRAMIKERGRPPANVHSLQGEITSVFFLGGGPFIGVPFYSIYTDCFWAPCVPEKQRGDRRLFYELKAWGSI